MLWIDQEWFQKQLKKGARSRQVLYIFIRLDLDVMRLQPGVTQHQSTGSYGGEDCQAWADYDYSSTQSRGRERLKD